MDLLRALPPGHRFLLESTRVSSEGRYSFVGAKPFLTFRARGTRCEVNGEPQPGEPLATLRGLLSRWRGARLPGMPLFCGGAVGFFANEAGELCEAPNGNLFLLLGDAVVTPPMEAPCLPGIIRSVLLEEGRLGDMPVVERPVGREQLETVRGCVLTNSVSLALAVPRLLGRELPGSHVLAERARAVVGEYARREE